MEPPAGSSLEVVLAAGELWRYRIDAEVDDPDLLTGVAGLPLDEMLHDYLWSLQFTISGGTSQVQRNIIAERILGLPREPR